MVNMISVLLVMLILIECVNLASNIIVWKSNKATLGREKSALESNASYWKEKYLTIEKENQELTRMVNMKHDAFETGIVIHHGGTKILPKGWQSAMVKLLTEAEER